MTAPGVATVALGPEQVRALLPHRHPMALLDRVDALVAHREIRARKAVSRGEECFADEPGALRYPSVLLLESWGQASGLLALASPRDDGGTGGVLVFAAASGVRFGRPVVPGDLLEHHVALRRATGDGLVLDGTTTVGDAVVLTVDRVVITLRPSATLSPPPAAPQEET